MDNLSGDQGLVQFGANEVTIGGKSVWRPFFELLESGHHVRFSCDSYFATEEKCRTFMLYLYGVMRTAHIESGSPNPDLS